MTYSALGANLLKHKRGGLSWSIDPKPFPCKKYAR